MQLASFRPIFAISFLLLLAACAERTAVAVAPPSGSVPVAVDLGGSSRIPHAAGLAGEGEGYRTVQPTPTGETSIAATAREVGAPMAKPSMPAMDHGGMDHGSMAGMSHSSDGNVQPAQASRVQGAGKINSVDPSGRKINLSHDAIPTIGWPAMTMDFPVAPSVDLGALKAGALVDFMMERGNDGTYVVRSITSSPGGQR